jgi:hypothetical protein
MDVKRELWMSTGGFCQNPACNQSLMKVALNGKRVFIEEFAHILPQSKGGPRCKGRRGNDGAAVHSPNNIVMLCPVCHKIVDAQEEVYTKKLLSEWKRTHLEKIQGMFHVPRFKGFNLLKNEVSLLLHRNKAIYDEYGPCSNSATKLLSDAARTWRRMVLSEIIPNNRRLLALLDGNRHLVKRHVLIIEQLRLHVFAFEFNHISGDKDSSAPLFPSQINKVFLR